MKKITLAHFVIRWLFGLMVLLVCIRVLGGHYYIQQLVDSSVQKVLKENAFVLLDYHKLSVSLFPPRVEVYDLDITSVDKKQRLVEVNHAKAYISLSALMLGRIQFKELTLDHLLLEKDHVFELIKTHVPTISARSANSASQKQKPLFTDMSQAESADYIFSYQDLFQSITIQNGHFDRRPLQIGSAIIDATYFELTLNLKKTQKKADFKLWGLRIQDGVYSYEENGSVEISLTYDGQKAVLERLNFSGSHITTSLSGQSQPSLESGGGFWQKWQLGGDVSMDLSLVGMLTSVGKSHGRWRGMVSSQLDFTEKPEVDLELDGVFNDAVLAGYRLYDSGIKMRMLSDQLLIVEDLMIQEKSHLYGKASGKVDLGQQKFQMELIPYQLGLGQIYDVIGLTTHGVDAQISEDPVWLSGTFAGGFVMDITGSSTFSNIYLPEIPSSGGQSSCRLDYHFEVSSLAMEILSAAGKCGAYKDLPLTDELSFTGRFPYVFYGDSSPEPARMNLRLIAGKFEGELGGYSQLVTPHADFSQLDLTVDMSGFYWDLGFKIRAEAEDFHLFDFSLGQFSAQMTYHVPAQRLRVGGTRVRVSAKKFGYDSGSGKQKGDGLINISSGYYDFSAHSLKLALEAAKLNPLYMAGLWKSWQHRVSTQNKQNTIISTGVDRLKLNLFVKDLHKKPITQGDAEIHGGSLSAGGEKWLESYNLTLSFAPKLLTLKPSELQLSESLSLLMAGSIATDFTASISEFFGPEGKLDMEFSTRGDGTDHLSTLPYLGKKLAAFQLSSELTGGGKLTGSVQQPVGKVSFTSDQLMIKGQILGPMALDLNFQGVTVETTLDIKNRGLVAWARYHFKDAFYELDIAMNRTNLMPFLLSSQGYPDPRHYFFADGAMKLSGVLGKPQTYQGFVRVDHLEMYLFSEGFGSNQNPCCTLFQSQSALEIQIDRARLRSQRPMELAALRGSGQLSLAANSSIESFGFVLSGKTDLSQYSGVHPQVGALSGDLMWQGSFGLAEGKSDYQLSFKLAEKEPGSLELTDFSPAFRDITLDITLDKQYLTVADFSARNGEGVIRGIPSRIRFDGSSQEGGLRFKGTENRLNIQHKILGPVRVLFGYDVTLTYGKSWLLLGEVNIEDVTSERPLSLLRDMFLDDSEMRLNRDWQPSSKDFLWLDLRLVADRSIQIRNYPLNLVMAGDLRLQGRPRDPSLKGYLEIVEGSFYYKQNYEITEGNIYFNDSSSINPIVEVKAQTDIQGYEVSIDVRGTAKEPKFQFTTSPASRPNGRALSQFEIMYLMANEQLPERGTETENQQDIVIGQAFSLAFNTVFDRLSPSDNLRKSFIRDISIQAYASRETEGRVLRASAPINTGQENLNVTVYGDVEEVGVKAEYELNSNVVTSFKYSEVSESLQQKREDSAPSVGMKFQFRFP